MNVKEVKRYFKYVALSLFGTATDTLVLWLLSDFVIDGYVGEYIIAPILSFECGVFVNFNVTYRYVWNDRLSQRTNKSYWRHFFGFNATFLLGFFIKMGLLLGLESITGWDVVLCNIISVIIAGCGNYFITNGLVFRKKRNAEAVCIDSELREFITNEIIPQYDSFDKGHGRDHVEKVIEQAIEIAQHYEVKPEIVYTAAAYHDLGIKEGRELHHLSSGRMIREDYRLLKWFNIAEIETIAQAAEDHRASSDSEPRTIYGKIIAEADRLIDVDIVIRRCVEFGLANHPELDKEEQWERTKEHIVSKYGENGYLKLWIPESPNAARLKELREIIKDEKRLREFFEKYCNG